MASAQFLAQMRDWQAARRANGENPYDWSAFQRHQIAIYAGDPGPSPIPEFGSNTQTPTTPSVPAVPKTPGLLDINGAIAWAQENPIPVVIGIYLLFMRKR